jgi:putative transposase
MTEFDVEIVLQRAREKYPGTSPRIITDNGPQFIAKDFKEFIRLAGLTHVKTSPLLPAKQLENRAMAPEPQSR